MITNPFALENAKTVITFSLLNFGVSYALKLAGIRARSAGKT